MYYSEPFLHVLLPDVPEFHQSINCIHFENLDITDKKSFHKSRNKKTPKGHDIF